MGDASGIVVFQGVVETVGQFHHSLSSTGLAFPLPIHPELPRCDIAVQNLGRTRHEPCRGVQEHRISFPKVVCGVLFTFCCVVAVS